MGGGIHKKRLIGDRAGQYSIRIDEQWRVGLRLLVAITGVAFANILIFTQLGIRVLLFEGVTLLPDNLKGNLFLVSAYAPTIDWGTFPTIHIYKVDAVEGVASASPLYISIANWVNPEDLIQPASSDIVSESRDGPPQITLFPNALKC